MRFDEIFLGGDKSAPVEGLASEARIQELHIIGFPGGAAALIYWSAEQK